MKFAHIEGGVPLNGVVQPSGSFVSASKLIFAALFTNEEVILQNVPNVETIKKDIALVESLGATCQWLSQNKLRIDPSGVKTFRVPFELGSRNKTSLLLAGPLLSRFGKAVLAKPVNTVFGPQPIDRYTSVWKDLGIEVVEDAEWIHLTSGEAALGDISFKNSTHTGTENAILSALSLKSSIVINNAAEEPEIDDLISFLILMGASIERVEPRKIRVESVPIRKGAQFEVQVDKNEVVFFSVAAVCTGGTVTIKTVNKTAISPFLSVLNNMGVNYEFEGSDLTVWHGGDDYSGVEVNSGPAPAFLTDWVPLLTVLATLAEGTTCIMETVYPESCGFVRDLNRMGASIDVASESGGAMIEISGPVQLKAVTLDIVDLRSGLSLLLGALSAQGTTMLRGLSHVLSMHENLIDKLFSLGAQLRLENSK